MKRRDRPPTRPRQTKLSLDKPLEPDQLQAAQELLTAGYPLIRVAHRLRLPYILLKEAFPPSRSPRAQRHRLQSSMHEITHTDPSTGVMTCNCGWQSLPVR